ncbi:hypothetical protein [Humidesulfovibrio sp.]
MTSIKWQAEATLPGLTRTSGADTGQASLAAGVSLYVDGSRVRVGPAQSGLNDPREHFSSSTQQRLIGTLTNALAGALSRLNERLDAVSWPVGGFGPGMSGEPFGSRTVSLPAELFGLHAGNSSSALSSVFPGALSASLNLPGQSSFEERLATTARAGSAASGLAAGTYGLTLSLGDSAEKLSVGIGAGWTTGQVFDAVASAVNGADLPVGASVRTNASGSFIGREVLALTADASLAGQAVGLAQTPGTPYGLASWLGVAAANVDTPARSAGDFGDMAALGATGVTAQARATPTRYASQGFDPEAPTTLAPGNYTLDYLVGPSTVGAPSSVGEAGSVSILVASGDTWRDVLSRMASALGSASPSMVARLVPARRVYDLPTGQHGLTDATGLEVLSNTVKSDWRLRLSGADAASQEFLAALGMDTLADPGSTARAVIGGQQRESASGTFSADSGRLSLGVSGTFGEEAPVWVRQGAQSLAVALADVLASYNEVGGLLSRNAGEVKDAVADDWTALAAKRAQALGSIGVGRASQALWLAEEDFLVALLARPGEVKDTLLGADGFLPALKQRVEAGLFGTGGTAGKGFGSTSGEPGGEAEPVGVESWISEGAKARAEEDAFAPYRRSQAARTEVEVEKSNQLLDLYDAADTAAPDFFTSGGGGGIVRRQG